MSETARQGSREISIDDPRRETSNPGFEELVSDLSARFITLPPGALEAEIVRTLGAIGSFMKSDRSFIFLPIEGGARHEVTHIWTQEKVLEDPVATGLVVQEVFPWVGEKMSRREDVVIDALDDLPPEAHRERSYCERVGIQSFLMCPMFSAAEVVGIIGIDAIRSARTWSAQDRRRVRLFGEVVANEILRQKSRDLEKALDEVQRRKDRLQLENRYLRREVTRGSGQAEIVAESAAMKRVLLQAQQVATTDSTVLLLGETGTGKEVLARAIHRLSQRSARALVAVNCAALSPTLVESELFGREKGAYTGAVNRQIGRFELADRSTVFLDEIGELSLELQTKLLRVLQTGEFERLGGPETHRVDVRIVAATNRTLEQEVREGSFREDLYYRLNVFPITVPPLRERPEDVPLLTWALVRELEGTMGRRVMEIPGATMAALESYPWPGNVRELRNILERAMILSADGVLRVGLPDAAPVAPPAPGVSEGSSRTLVAVETEHIRATLEQKGWRIRGPEGAAAALGLKPSTLESRMKKLGIRRS